MRDKIMGIAVYMVNVVSVLLIVGTFGYRLLL